MDSLPCIGIEYFPIVLGHDVVSRVITFGKKKFGKYELFEGLLNSSLCVIKVKINFKVHHISKRMFFMTIIKYKH
jgi:hypothetical protein